MCVYNRHTQIISCVCVCVYNRHTQIISCVCVCVYNRHTQIISCVCVCVCVCACACVCVCVWAVLTQHTPYNVSTQTISEHHDVALAYYVWQTVQDLAQHSSHDLLQICHMNWWSQLSTLSSAILYTHISKLTAISETMSIAIACIIYNGFFLLLFIFLVNFGFVCLNVFALLCFVVTWHSAANSEQKIIQRTEETMTDNTENRWNSPGQTKQNEGVKNIRKETEITCKHQHKLQNRGWIWTGDRAKGTGGQMTKKMEVTGGQIMYSSSRSPG